MEPPKQMEVKPKRSTWDFHCPEGWTGDHVDCRYIIYGYFVNPDGVADNTPKGLVVFKTAKHRDAALKSLTVGDFAPRHLTELSIKVDKAIALIKDYEVLTERGTRPMSPQEKGRAGHAAMMKRNVDYDYSFKYNRWRRLREYAEEDNLDAIDDEDRVKYFQAIEYFRNEGLKKRKTQEYAAGSLSPVLK